MTAFHFYVKYVDNFFGNTSLIFESEEVVQDLLNDFLTEVKKEYAHTLSENELRGRLTSPNEAINAAIENLNGVWNTLYTLFKKRHGISPIQLDGLKNVCNEPMIFQSLKGDCDE